jgi:hypothetical protein
MVPLTLLCTLAADRASRRRRFFDAESDGHRHLVTGIAGPLLFQMTPLRIDHHASQIVSRSLRSTACPARSGPGRMVVGGALAAACSRSQSRACR